MLLLLLQTAVLYSSVRPELVPANAPLSALPHKLGSWNFFREDVVDQETQDVLKADDSPLYRFYVDRLSRALTAVSLFVAGFRSQRNGKTPHSPRYCLPGSGWTQLSNSLYPIQLETGRQLRIESLYRGPRRGGEACGDVIGISRGIAWSPMSSRLRFERRSTLCV